MGVIFGIIVVVVLICVCANKSGGGSRSSSSSYSSTPQWTPSSFDDVVRVLSCIAYHEHSFMSVIRKDSANGAVTLTVKVLCDSCGTVAGISPQEALWALKYYDSDDEIYFYSTTLSKDKVHSMNYYKSIMTSGKSNFRHTGADDTGATVQFY